MNVFQEYLAAEEAYQKSLRETAKLREARDVAHKNYYKTMKLSEALSKVNWEEYLLGGKSLAH